MWALARAGLRRRLPLLGLAVLLALGLGTAVASLEASVRTEEAYPSYLRRSEVGDLVVNPGLITGRAEEIIATTPGVLGYVSDSLLNAVDDRAHPTAQAEADSSATQVLMSTDGRYLSQDRPVVREGRMIRSGPEAFVNVEMAEALGLRVGSVLPLAFYPVSSNADDTSADLEPYGRAEVRVVGIGLFQDEVQVDGLYPKHRVLITGDVGSRYDCALRQPAADDPRPLEEISGSISPSWLRHAVPVLLAPGRGWRPGCGSGGGRAGGPLRRGERPPPGLVASGRHQLRADPDGHLR